MGRKKRQVILPPTFVGAQPSRPGASAPGGNVPNSVGPILDGFKLSAINAMKIADDLAKAAFLESLSALSGRLEQEVVVVRQELGGAQQSNIESLQGEIAARSVLLERKTIDLGRQQEQANSYYGSSPFGKSAEHYAGATFQSIATGRIRVANIQEALNAAYRAAYMVQLREAEIQMLQAQIAAQQQALHTAQEQLRAEAEAQAEAEAAARAQAEAEAAARAQAEVEATRLANSFTVSGSTAVGGPLVVTALGHVVSTALNFSPSVSIGAALAALRGAAGVAVPFVAGAAALLYSSRLGNGELPERYVLQMPLGTLDPQLSSALASGSAIGSHAELPYRLSSQATEAEDSEILVVKTDGQVVPSQVRVLAATQDQQHNLY
ncbi:S-type pyocin domain-containing protein, partial [Pseudomonas sp.]|uniref:S-type pyocin domain-containing protein n=1 Tax=Pseudomonas sp. TaxID=306 RepID=UPI0028B002D9